METHRELAAENASRMAITAVTADVEYWARSASIDGQQDPG
jgi:hypothetical protein